MSTTKPTIVLLPGAWLPSIAYHNFLSALNAAGYSTHLIQYPSFNPSNPASCSVAIDTIAIRDSLAPLTDSGTDVVLLMHSYAAMPGTAAAKGLSVLDRRASGRKGGILGLVCVAGFVVPEGRTCVDFTGGQLAPWILPDTPSAGLNVPRDPARMFGPDYPANEAALLGALCEPHATLAFTTVQPASAVAGEAYDGRLGFIVTTRDEEVSKEAQHAMFEGSGREWMVREVEGSHMSPFGGRLMDKAIQVLAEMVEAFRSIDMR